MNSVVLNLFIESLQAAFPPQMVKEAIDDLLDKLEDKIKESETTLDDVYAQKMIDYLRKVMDIPDDIGGDED